MSEKATSLKNEIQVSATELNELLPITIKANLVPMIWGKPGIGKSTIVEGIAKKFNLKLIDYRLSQCDPTDMNGFPVPDMEKGRSSYLPPEDFPLEKDEVPQGYKGWLVFFDEISSAMPAVQAACYKILLDRMVGQHKLHKNVIMIGAGNNSTDGAYAFTMNTALQSRLVHYNMQSSTESWLEWAGMNGIDHRIRSFVAYEQKVNDFDPKHTDHTFMCERTCEMLSKQLKKLPGDPTDIKFLPMIAGTIGLGKARTFMSFCKVYKDLVDIKDIIKDPMNTKVPTDNSAIYALTGVIRNAIDKNTIDPILKYLNRLPLEFQMLSLDGLYKLDPSLMQTKAFQDWINKNATNMVKYAD